MYNGFDSTISKILGGAPKKDKRGKNMSQENWEEANKKARQHGFSTNPASKRRIIVSPYIRATNKHPEARSVEGAKTMAMRLELHESMPEDQKSNLMKEMDRLKDLKLQKSYLFKDVVKPFGSRKKVDPDQVYENL